MKFLVISDLHGDLEKLDALDRQFAQADAVLFGGDFAKFNHPQTGLPALEKLCEKHDTIFSVIGNCDEKDFITQTEAHDISVEKQLVMHQSLAFCGSGGGSYFTGTTPNEKQDQELLDDFKIITEQGQTEWNNLIAIMHNPPKDTDCDKIANGAHVGSPLLRQFIEDYKPLAVITGHIHESAAICKINETTIINPGALTEGKYAWLSVEKENNIWKVSNASLENLK